ncbi:MAG: hypothetical protein R3F30_02635 [Planctomycetota bacterium]
MRNLLVPALLLLAPALAAQTASYGPFGGGCAGSPLSKTCPSSNGSVAVVSSTHNSNIFANPVTPTTALVVLGWRYYNKSVTNQNETIPTALYLADSAGKPQNPPVATSTMLVTTQANWHVTKLATPVVIKPNQTFFISHNGSTKVTWEWDGSGSNYIHYWHSQTATAWNGPFTSAKWAFRIDCSAADNVPTLSNTGVPKINGKFSVDLTQALPSSAAGLIIGASNTKLGAIPLPLDLAVFGAPTCSLLVSFEALLGTPTDATGNASVSLPLPNDTKLLGINFYNQYFVVDKVANGLGLSWSNGGAGLIGN